MSFDFYMKYIMVNLIFSPASYAGDSLPWPGRGNWGSQVLGFIKKQIADRSIMLWLLVCYRKNSTGLHYIWLYFRLEVARNIFIAVIFFSCLRFTVAIICNKFQYIAASYSLRIIALRPVTRILTRFQFQRHISLALHGAQSAEKPEPLGKGLHTII